MMRQTETADIRALEELGWIITSLSTPVLVIKPPSVFLELGEVEEEEVLPGDVNFVPLTRGRSIDTLTHRALLEESVTEYRDIWRTLAER